MNVTGSIKDKGAFLDLWTDTSIAELSVAEKSLLVQTLSESGLLDSAQARCQQMLTTVFLSTPPGDDLLALKRR